MYLLEDHDQYSTSFVQFFAWFETIILSYLSWCPLLPQPLYPPHTWRHYASDGSQLELPWEHKNTTHLGGRKQIWSLHYYLCWSLERNLVNNGLEMKGIFTFVKENWEIQCCNEILLSMDHWVCYKISPYKTIRGHSQMTSQHWTTNGNSKKLTRRDQGSSEKMMNDEKSNNLWESIQKRP